MNMNDEVIKKTNTYLNMFTQFQNVEVSKEMRQVARKHNIKAEYCIHIQDLGLRDYDEVVSLYPVLKEHPKENIEELIEIVKLNSN